ADASWLAGHAKLGAGDDISTGIRMLLHQEHNVGSEGLLRLVVVSPVHHLLGAMVWGQQYIPYTPVSVSLLLTDFKDLLDRRVLAVTEEESAARGCSVFQRDLERKAGVVPRLRHVVLEWRMNKRFKVSRNVFVVELC